MFVKVFDIVESYIDCAVDEEKGTVKKDSEKMDILREYCSVIDGIMENWSGSSIDVQVIGDNAYVVVSVTVSALVMDADHPQYYDLVDRAVAFAVGQTEDHDVRLDFTFPSVYEV